MSENCSSCGASSPVNYTYSTSCEPTTKKCEPIDASCVIYTGANLVCTDTEPNTDLETILLRFDARFCQSVTGSDYTLYDLSCLDDVTIISTEKEFVEKISAEVCALKEATWLNTDTLANNFLITEALAENHENPNIVFSSQLNIPNNSNLQTILIGFGDNLDTIYGKLTLTGVDWNGSTPTSISDAFENVLSKITSVENDIPTVEPLPTFDTTGSPLPTQATDVPLSEVVNELILKSNYWQEYDSAAVIWGSTSPTTDSLTDAVKLLAYKTNLGELNLTNFDTAQFNVTPPSIGGRLVTLKSETLQGDGKIYASPTATVKDYLSNILELGEGLYFDVSTPNTIKISSNTIDSGMVQASSESNKVYLETAIVGKSTDGLTVTAQRNGDQIEISANIVDVQFVNRFLDILKNNETLMQKFCNIMCQCSPCNP